jgi:ABC-type multidrug transport system ATPase subunit
MEISLNGVSKRFGREVVFHEVDLVLPTGSHTAILGPNGSGKSTLLQVIGGALAPSSGAVIHRLNDAPIAVDEVYPHVVFATPYLGLYEDLSLRQTLDLHFRIKPLRSGLALADVASIAYLEQAMDKPVLHFSSGMKQRLKLALAILSDTPLLLLDEPASNLDADAVAWYRTLVRQHIAGRTVLVASNAQAAEHDLCTTSVDIRDMKA